MYFLPSARKRRPADGQTLALNLCTIFTSRRYTDNINKCTDIHCTHHGQPGKTSCYGATSDTMQLKSPSEPPSYFIFVYYIVSPPLFLFLFHYPFIPPSSSIFPLSSSFLLPHLALSNSLFSTVKLVRGDTLPLCSLADTLSTAYILYKLKQKSTIM